MVPPARRRPRKIPSFTILISLLLGIYLIAIFVVARLCYITDQTEFLNSLPQRTPKDSFAPAAAASDDLPYDVISAAHGDKTTKESVSLELTVDRKIDDSRETAIIIPTHLVPSHPSLHYLMEVINSIKSYVIGLHPEAPIIITVDNLKADSKKNRATHGLFLLDNGENRMKFKLFLEALTKQFENDHHIKILVSESAVGLAKNLQNAVNILHRDTKYMYIIQHDLPFIKEINHTAVVKTANEYPDLVRIIRFNLYGAVNDSYGCGEPDIHANGITLKKFKKWSDQNHFASVEHYKRDIIIATTKAKHVFPEARLQQIANKNCTYYGPYYYYYNNYGGPWYKHLDATERYGAKLAARIERGDVDISALSKGNLKDLEMNHINTTKLQLEMGLKIPK